MPTGLLAAIADYLDDFVWFNWLWGDDTWGWRRILLFVLIAAVLAGASYYFWGREV